MSANSDVDFTTTEVSQPEVAESVAETPKETPKESAEATHVAQLPTRESVEQRLAELDKTLEVRVNSLEEAASLELDAIDAKFKAEAQKEKDEVREKLRKDKEAAIRGHKSATKNWNLVLKAIDAPKTEPAAETAEVSKEADVLTPETVTP